MEGTIKESFAIHEDFHRMVTADLSRRSHQTISTALFGDNLEHTRDCINSGLSAQMLKNRKFVGLPSRDGCALNWEPIGQPVTAYSYLEAYTHHYEGYRMVRAHECNAQVITGYTGDVVGISQKGLFLKNSSQYSFSMTAKVFAPLTVTIRLLGNDGAILDQVSIFADRQEYQSYGATLCPSCGDSNGVLEISFCGPGTLTLGAVSLMDADNFHGMRRDVIKKMKELGTRLLRWPGGNFSGEYHWKDGLLPRDERAPFQSYLWVETQPHTWGYDYHEINTDDFIALCREIGAEPFITINPTWNTPEDSAHWVEYCNGDASTPYGKIRAQRGYPEPYRVKIWSLGNEFGYGHMEGTNGAPEYAAAVRKHAEKMLEVSPELKLCSCGPYPNQEWATDSAQALKDVASMVSLHHYAEFPAYIDPAARESEYYGFIHKVDTEYIPRMQALRQQLGEDIAISFDEWNAWVAWYRRGSITEGIFAARFLNLLYMNAEKYGICQACHFESVNEGAIYVHPDRAVLTPTGQAIAAMKDHAGGQVCVLEEDLISTRREDTLTCTLINRSYDKEKCFLLHNPGQILEATLYSGEGVVANTFFNQSDLAVETGDSFIRTVLPPHSIALIKTKIHR